MVRPPTRAARHDDSAPPSPFSEKEWDEVSRSLRLSPRQAKIVGLILRGQRDKQIAASLKTSVSTVRTHLSHIFTRLGVADRIELVLHVFSHFRHSDGQGARHRK